MTEAQQQLYDRAVVQGPRAHIKAVSTANGYWFIKVLK